jgi:hypothetical protein
MVNQKELLEALNQFIGTENYYKLNPQVNLTDGTKYLMEVTSSSWIGDLVWSFQKIEKVNCEPFQVYTITCDTELSKGGLICTDGNGKVLQVQKLHYTDFPLREMTLYYCDKVLMLPSEY